MSDHSNIEWTDATWSPTVGCLKVSPGCENCYAIDTAYRQEHAFKRPEYQGTTRKLPDGSRNWTGTVRTLPGRLTLPLKWRTPRRIFVDSMSDLFHADMPDEFLDKVFATMAITARHTYQVLTKRPERMQRYVADPEARCRIGRLMTLGVILTAPGRIDVDGGEMAEWHQHGVQWPLPNVWLGVSVEDQQRADARIPLLLQTPAAVRWLSCEPLLGPVDLWAPRYPWPDRAVVEGQADLGSGFAWGRGIQWVVAGGESGAHARPMDPGWARSLRDQCQAAGVAFYFKQWGGRTHAAGGRELDGRTWDEYPVTAYDCL